MKSYSISFIIVFNRVLVVQCFRFATVVNHRHARGFAVIGSRV